MTAQLSRERLQHYARLPSQPFEEGASVFMYEVRAMARMLLAGMGSEPYWWAIENRHGDARFIEGEHAKNDIWDEVHELNEKDDAGEYFDSDAPYTVVPVFRHSAPPAPVAALRLPPKLSNDRESAHELNTGVDTWNRCIDEVAKLNGQAIAANPVEDLHPSTVALVNDFATALAEKLRKAEQKYGYSDAWTNNGWMTECQADFHRHIAKGDPRDVAAYCAFMWYHGWKTELPAPSIPSGETRVVSLDVLGAACGALQRYAPESNTLKLLRRHTFGDLSNQHHKKSKSVPNGWPKKLTWSYHDDISQAEVSAWNSAIDACRAAMQSFGNSEQLVRGEHEE